MFRMITILFAVIFGSSGNVLRQTAVWVRLVYGLENVPLMGVL